MTTTQTDRGTTQQATFRVLVVDDEKDLAEVVSRYLHRAGYDVTQAHDGLQALQLARSVLPDVVILDLNLPGRDGLAVCRALREFSDCYVVMLTARVDAMLRRPRQLSTADEAAETDLGSTPAGDAARRELDGMVIDFQNWQVSVDGNPVELTRTQFDLLAALTVTPGRVLSRADLILEVWGDDWTGDDRLVDVHIAHLRRKLGDTANEPRFIRTVRGRGYRVGEFPA